LALFGIQSGERGVLVPALGLAFASLGAFALTNIASDTLFVSAFDLGAVSRFYLVATLARGSFALLYGAAASRLTLPRLDGAVLVLTGAVMVAAGTAVGHASASVIYAVCVLLAFSPSVLPLIAFNAASACFHPRQAKRLVPLVGAAGTVGCIAVGAAARVLVHPLGTGSLLVGGGMLCVAALPLVRVMAQKAPPSSEEKRKGGPPRARWLGLADALRDSREVPVVRLFLLHALLGGFAAVVVDFGFKAALKERYQHEQMAAFLGSFSVATNALVLVVQLFLTQRIMSRFGVPGALKTLPASLVAVGAFATLVPSLTSAAGAKLVESVARLSLGGAVSDLLLLPTLPHVRARAKAIARGVVVPLATVIAFAALGPFAQGSARAVGVLLIAGGVIGSLAVATARRAYVSALARALGDRQISQEVVREAAVLGPFLPAAIASLRSEARRLLTRALAANDADKCLQVVTLMADPMFSPADIAPAALSPLASVRRAAVRTACQIARPGDGERLMAAIGPQADPELEQMVVLRARQLGYEPPAERVSSMLTGISPSIEPERRAILSGDRESMADLVQRLSQGPGVLAAADALALTGPNQIDQLVDALQTARGTARAAHVLASAGPHAHARVLDRFSELGYRGRNAVIRSFAMTHGRKKNRQLETRAPAIMESLLVEAEGLFVKHGQASGLLGHEVRHRIRELTSRVLDLASFGRGNESIARARWALARHDHSRGQALELLENLLPQGVARRLVTILEEQPATSLGYGRPGPIPRDAWLLNCHRYDTGKMDKSDPMMTVLERVAILRKAPIFAELSAEELCRVGEIATEVPFASGDTIVRQGDPADSLFVVVEGKLEVHKDDIKVRELENNTAFGEIALLDGGPRAATVVAKSGGRLLKVPGDEFHMLLDHTPELSRGVIRVLVGYLRGTSDPASFGDR
jgi:hypothetical protein